MQQVAELEASTPTPLTKGQSLIVTMSPSQKRMLSRFGTIVGIDATYRVTMWGLPFFVVAIVNAQGEGFPVAFFWISEESSQDITEVLLLMRQMVPTWEPTVIITDKCDAEINAIKAAFPRCFVLLCDFHVKQAWQRWLNTSKHGVGDKAAKEYAYKLLVDIAHAENLPMLQDAVSTWESFLNDGENEDMSRWWTNEWEGCMQMWCKAHRSNIFTRGFNTNNHNEALNKSLKQYLAERYDLKVGSMVRELYKTIVPFYVEKHAKKQAEEMGKRPCTIQSPVLQGGTPAKFPAAVTKVLLRSEKAGAKISLASVFKVPQPEGGDDLFKFTGRHGDTYAVDIAEGTCSCPFFATRRIPCKHMMCALTESDKTIFDLPRHILEAPHMSFDLDSLKGQTYKRVASVAPQVDETPTEEPVHSFDDITEEGNAEGGNTIPQEQEQPCEQASPEMTKKELKSKMSEHLKMITTAFYFQLDANPEIAKDMLELAHHVLDKGREGQDKSSQEFQRREGTRMRNARTPLHPLRKRAPLNFVGAQPDRRGVTGAPGTGGGGKTGSAVGGRTGSGVGGRKGSGVGTNTEFERKKGKGRPPEKKRRLMYSAAALRERGAQKKAKKGHQEEPSPTAPSKQGE
jgi:hypothetical protein